MFSAAAENAPLPYGVCRSGAHVGSRLHEITSHLIRAGELKLPDCLVDSCERRSADRDVHVVGVPGGISDGLQAFGPQLLYRPPD